MSIHSPSSTRHAHGIHWSVVIICFLAVLLDGFDTATLAFAIPTLSQEWGLAPSDFTLPLVLTNIGVVIGYLSCGFFGARMGSRRLLIYGVALFSVATALTALTLSLQSIPILTLLRLLTGLGLGVTLPSGIALATRHSAPRRRALVSVTVTLGLASGATVGGFFGGRLLLGVGTAGVFWIAAVLPLVLSAFMIWLLPAEAPRGDAAEAARHEAKVGRLFDPGLRVNTSLLWGFSFLIFISAYTLTSWVPTLLTEYGFGASEAPLGLAFLSLGGITGGILLIPLAAKFGITRSLILMPVIGAICMVLAATAPLSRGLLLLALGGAGLGVTASQIGQLALAVALYPTGTRTTGVGWAAALGRAGSIVGPGIAGALLALAVSGQDIILLTTIPVLLAVLCAIALWRRKPDLLDDEPLADPESDPALSDDAAR